MPSNYSFIDEFIAGSAMPYEVEDIDQYITDGITHVISLTPKLPLVSNYVQNHAVTFHHYPIYATPDDQQIGEFLDLMKSVQKNNEKAVIHCQYGQERTGMFLACYLVEVKGYSVDDAIEEIKSKRSSSLQTQHARLFLKDRYG